MVCSNCASESAAQAMTDYLEPSWELEVSVLESQSLGPLTFSYFELAGVQGFEGFSSHEVSS